MLLFLLMQVGATTPLSITCLGGGTANKPAIANVFGSHSGSGHVGSQGFGYSGTSNATVVSKRQQEFSEQVDVRLFDGNDRIRMPRTMLPPIHGGNDGWFPLKKVVADERSIKATVGVSFINSPKLYIDRTTGTISISGKAGDFTGQCEAMTAEQAPKF